MVIKRLFSVIIYFFCSEMTFLILALMCPGCQKYSPCLSACTKTCDNFECYSEVKADCEETCVEGCECPDNMVCGIIFVSYKY